MFIMFFFKNIKKFRFRTGPVNRGRNDNNNTVPSLITNIWVISQPRSFLNSTIVVWVEVDKGNMYIDGYFLQYVRCIVSMCIRFSGSRFDMHVFTDAD